jgi:hypothetical protein
MLLSRHSFSPLKLLIPLIFVFGTAIYLFNTPRQNAVPDFTYHDNVAVPDKKGKFVQRFLETEIDGPYDINPLKELCASRNWTEGLIVKCMPPPGGVGNVKNILLNCLRFALEAGGLFPSAVYQDVNSHVTSNWTRRP